jgi:hypothetical protein
MVTTVKFFDVFSKKYIEYHEDAFFNNGSELNLLNTDCSDTYFKTIIIDNSQQSYRKAR